MTAGSPRLSAAIGPVAALLMMCVALPSASLAQSVGHSADGTPRSGALGTGQHQSGQHASGQLQADQRARSLLGHGGPVHVISLNANKDRALTGSFDNSMMLWDLSQEPAKSIARFDEHEGAIKSVLFLPGEKYGAAAGGDGQIWIWDLASGALAHRLEGHRSEITALTLSPDGKLLASASTDRTARIWNLADFTPGAVFTGHRAPVTALRFSADGARVFSASSDGSIQRWLPGDGTFERVVYHHGFGINALERVPGSDQLVFGSLDGRAGVVDADSGELIKELGEQDGPVLALAVLDKPGLVAVSGSCCKGRGGLIRVWRSGDWSLLEEYDDPYGPIWALDFGFAGATLLYGGLNDFVSIWQVTPREPFERAEGEALRRFQVGEEVSLGERQFARKCSLCHTLEPDGRNRAGPSLFNVFGRRAGTLAGFPYSKALKGADIVWNEETIGLLFAQGPDEYTPGSKMPLQRITDDTVRDALIDYLKVATASGGGAHKSGEQNPGQ